MLAMVSWCHFTPYDKGFEQLTQGRGHDGKGAHHGGIRIRRTLNSRTRDRCNDSRVGLRSG